MSEESKVTERKMVYKSMYLLVGGGWLLEPSECPSFSDHARDFAWVHFEGFARVIYSIKVSDIMQHSRDKKKYRCRILTRPSKL